MSITGHKTRTAIQLVFLLVTVILAVIWCDAIGRGINDFFVPLLILICVGVVAVTALPKVLLGDIPGGAIWTYSPLCLAMIVLGGMQIVWNISHSISFFPSSVTLERLISKFSLASLYIVLMDSWIFAVLHIIVGVTGVLSVYMAIKEREIK
ncbi:MAG: hypothetical protein GXY05_14690 [Clostridiales bacterium]|nr:hypothetical protein [Clostridiales bacterium]